LPTCNDATSKVGVFRFGLWQHDSYNEERITFAHDITSLGDARRSDSIYEIGGGVTWEFAPGWTLKPEIVWLREQSNILIVNYSSTEVFINLRKDF
jgi:hypothetical protein